MQNREAKELLKNYREGKCTEEEIAILESWYLDGKDEAGDLVWDELLQARDKVWASLPVHDQHKHAVRLWPRIAVAASVMICVAAGLLFYQKRQALATANDQKVTAIVPGGNKAVLTLVDGSKIALNEAANGSLARQSGIMVTKAKDGQLIYQINAGSLDKTQKNLTTEYNTITTPKGGQYQVNLPDGTKVWLNAASSLTFPVVFARNERKVKLSGEGYFEVAHNKLQPFKVTSDSQTITVLGTHFNVSAYKDDNHIATTLLEGKVKVQLNEIDVYAELNPGEQSVLKGRTFNVQKVNADNAIAWVNNSFVFDNEELGSIMRKISRWYNVEVACPPDMEKIEFSGTGSRSKSIQDILKIIEFTESVHFKFEGRRITVMP
jgi:transmembrane sensor